VDGVIFNYAQSLQDFVIEHYHITANLDFSSKQWFMKGRFDTDVIDKIGYKNIEREFIRAGRFNNLTTMPDSSRLGDIFSHHEIFFVTSIAEHLHDSRLENLQKVIHPEIKSEQLICLTPPQSKKATINQIKPDYFIEDSLNNLAQCYGEHTSIWVNLNEKTDTYDLEHLKRLKIHEVFNLNQALDIVLGEKIKTIKKANYL